MIKRIFRWLWGEDDISIDEMLKLIDHGVLKPKEVREVLKNLYKGDL